MGFESLPVFSEDDVVHVELKAAVNSGLISDDEFAFFDGIMQEFPEAWQEHFEPRFSEQMFAPTGKQLVAHGVVPGKQPEMMVTGVLLEEKIGELKEDGRHLAVMFRGA